MMGVKSGAPSVQAVLDDNSDEDGIRNSRSSAYRLYWRELAAALRSWRGTVLVGTFITVLVFLANLTWLIWMVATRPHDSNGIYTLWSDTCEKVNRASIGVHLVVNLFSSLLLGASSFCIQAVSSPSREDIDKSHKQGKWVSIGMFSMRNLRAIPLKRTVVCVLLAVTSIPLAFIYNASIVNFLLAATYRGVVVDESIFTDGPRIVPDASIEHVDPMTWVATCKDNLCSGLRNDTATPLFNSPGNSLLAVPPADYWADISAFSNGNGGFSELTRLKALECGRVHESLGVTEYSNYMLVVNEPGALQNVLTSTATYPDMFNAEYLTTSSRGPSICGPSCMYNTGTGEMRYSLQQSFYDNNTLGISSVEVEIAYCMVQEIEQQCAMGASVSLVAVIVALNLVKVVCLLYALFSISFRPIATLGDALDSFLQRPDDSTEHQSSLSLVDVKRGLWSPCPRPFADPGRIFKSGRRLWVVSTSLWRWLALFITGVSLCIVGIVMINLIVKSPTIRNYSIDFAPAAFGAGSTSDLWFKGEEVPPVWMSIIANTPQVLISLSYLFYNSILTSMCLIREYGSYTTKRQGLRVSRPRGSQRGSYFLSLPFQYSAPLLAVMVLLHWTVSEALAPVYWSGLATSSRAGSASLPSVAGVSVYALGFSASAIIISLVIGGIFLLSLPLLGMRRHPRGFVIAANCSAAISASCHGLQTTLEKQVDPDVGSRPLRYGVLPEQEDLEENQELSRTRRLGFSAGPIDPLQDGVLCEAPSRYSGDKHGREGWFSM